MSESTQKAATSAAAAVSAVSVELAKASAAENDALNALVDVRKRRNDVALSVVDASVGIALLGELEAAEEHHDVCSKRSRDLHNLRTDLVRAHERAAREHHQAEQREALPAAQAAFAEDLISFEAWVRAHLSAIDALRAGGQNVSGTGFTDRYTEILRRHNLTPALGSNRP